MQVIRYVQGKWVTYSQYNKRSSPSWNDTFCYRRTFSGHAGCSHCHIICHNWYMYIKFVKLSKLYRLTDFVATSVKSSTKLHSAPSIPLFLGLVIGTVFISCLSFFICVQINMMYIIMCIYTDVCRNNHFTVPHMLVGGLETAKLFHDKLLMIHYLPLECAKELSVWLLVVLLLTILDLWPADFLKLMFMSSSPFSTVSIVAFKPIASNPFKYSVVLDFIKANFFCCVLGFTSVYGFPAKLGYSY